MTSARAALIVCAVLVGCTGDESGDAGRSEAGTDASRRDASTATIDAGKRDAATIDAAREGGPGDGGEAPLCRPPSAPPKVDAEVCKACLEECVGCDAECVAGMMCQWGVAPCERREIPTNIPNCVGRCQVECLSVPELCMQGRSEPRSPGRKVPGPCFIEYGDSRREYVYYDGDSYISWGGSPISLDHPRCLVEQWSGTGDYAPSGFEWNAQGRLRGDCDGSSGSPYGRFEACCEVPDGGDVCDDAQGFEDAGEWSGCLVSCNDRGDIVRVADGDWTDSVEIGFTYDEFGNIMTVTGTVTGASYNYDCWCPE